VTAALLVLAIAAGLFVGFVLAMSFLTLGEHRCLRSAETYSAYRACAR
jgi:hypothetical protein